MSNNQNKTYYAQKKMKYIHQNYIKNSLLIQLANRNIDRLHNLYYNKINQGIYPKKKRRRHALQITKIRQH